MSNPYSGGNGYGRGPGNGSGGGSYGFGPGSSNTPYGSSFNYAQLTSLRAAHGVLASLALVFFFPMGAIIVRLLPGKWTVAIHIAFQVTGYLLFTVAVGLGIYIAQAVDFPNYSLLHQAHPIIGLVVFSLITFQPILGLLHHRYFKKYKRRTVWSYGHLWLGRIVITLGIINGALGLDLADNSEGGLIAYSIIAAIFWLAWMGAAVYGEIKRRRKAPEHPPSYEESIPLGHQAHQQHYLPRSPYAAADPNYSASSHTQLSGGQLTPEYYGKDPRR